MNDAEIDALTTEALITEGAQLIDVRTREEWDGARLHGATHIPLDSLAGRAAEIDKDKPVVFYCYSGARSAMAAQAFRASGFEAYTLTDGIVGWTGSGRAIEPPGAPIVH